MIAAILFFSSAVAPNVGGNEISRFANIVQPVAECEQKFETQAEAMGRQWRSKNEQRIDDLRKANSWNPSQDQEWLKAKDQGDKIRQGMAETCQRDRAISYIIRELSISSPKSSTKSQAYFADMIFFTLSKVQKSLWSYKLGNENAPVALALPIAPIPGFCVKEGK